MTQEADAPGEANLKMLSQLEQMLEAFNSTARKGVELAHDWDYVPWQSAVSWTLVV